MDYLWSAKLFYYLLPNEFTVFRFPFYRRLPSSSHTCAPPCRPTPPLPPRRPPPPRGAAHCRPRVPDTHVRMRRHELARRRPVPLICGMSGVAPHGRPATPWGREDRQKWGDYRTGPCEVRCIAWEEWNRLIDELVLRSE